MRILILVAFFLTFFNSNLLSQKISSGIKANNYGVMWSSDIRYNLWQDSYNVKVPVQLGIGYSDFFDKSNPNKRQYTGSVGAYLNNECSFELEVNYIQSEGEITDHIYYNIGFRLETDYNVSYDIKMGQSLIQLGVLYTIDMKKLFKK